MTVYVSFEEYISCRVKWIKGTAANIPKDAYIIDFNAQYLGVCIKSYKETINTMSDAIPTIDR